MKKYESVLIFRPSLQEADITKQSEEVKAFLESKGAQNVVVKPWGRLEMAVEFDRNSTGTYIAFHYESKSGGIVGELASSLRINDTLLKFQTHRIPEKAQRFRGNPKLLEENKAPAAAAD